MLNFTFRKFNSFKLIFIVLLLFATTQTRAQFPFFQSFKNNTAPGLQFGGSPVAFLTGGAGLKNGYNDPIGSGYLRLTNSDGNQKGITWSDTYAFPSAYGMTISFEYYTHGGNGADGIAFILFDATASPVTAGAFGGSLGYAQRNSEEGFSKGYLGIGIDEYGNFSANNEGKSGGVAVRSSNVTLRGKGTGLVGYPYLTSVQTTALASPFNVAGGDRTATDITKAGFRKMEVVLRPRSGGGFFIDVYLTHGSVRDLIINNYEYSTVSPSNLKFAISSSTGGSNNFHEIRNLNITVDPNTLLTPVASADSFSGCVGLAATSGDITANDNGTVNTLGTINKSTVDLDVLTPGIQTSKTLLGQGTFTYNSTTASVTFTPINNTIVGPVEIDYTFNDSYGKTSSNSKIKYIAYTPISDNVIAAPSQAIFCSGSANPDIINGLAATGGTINPLIYQWESSSDNITFSPISGATNVNYDPPLLSTTTYYRRIVTSAACSNTSNVVAIIFGQASTPTATSATTVTCDGFTANWKTVSNAQSYGLFVSKNSDFSTHEGNYDGRNLTTATSYSITGLTTGTTYYYKVVAMNTCGASAISSNAITVLVGSGSVPGSVSSPQTICSGTSPADLTLSGYAGTIQWQSSANNSTFNDISGATGPTLTSVQMGVLTANTYYRASVSSGACPATNSPSILVTINPNPTLGSAAQAATVCSGSTARINLTGLLPSSTFTVSYSIDGFSQIPISGISSDATGAVGFDSAVLPSSANGKILKITGITITSATPNCNSIVNKDVTLSVNSPSVGGNIASVASICAGTSPANLVLNGNTGTVVKWQKASDVAFSTPVDIAGTSTTLPGSTIGNLTANTYFRAIVKNGICSAEFSGSVLVTVNSLPVALSLTGSTICTLPGGNGKITSTTSVSGITYQLYNSSNIAVQTAKAGTGSALSWTGLSAGNGYYVIGTNTSTTCSSPSNIVDVVNDTQKPTIACPSNVTAIADANSCAATGVVLGTPTTSDNCSGTVTVTNNAPSSFPIGVTTVTWTATDGMGNTQTCTQTVTVSDTQKPTITCPSNVTAVADVNSCTATGVVLGTPTTSDNCTGTITVTNNAPSSFPIGNTIVTWAATDAAGNTQTCTQTVTVSDTQKPTITCPSNVTAVADTNSCVAAGVVLGTPTTSDNCIGTVTVTNNAPSSFPIGNTIVTWTATDAAGNTQTCTQTVTVSDTQKPTITCPSNVTAVADANSCVAAGVVLGIPATTDNCTGTVTVTNNAPSSFPIGVTTVTWTATDAAGNTQTCTQTVTVSDTQKPTITCPSNVTAVADANSCAATGVVLGTPTTSDNCTGTITVTNNAPSSFPIGVTTVTWTATDAAGNTQTCTQTVTVSDTQKPTITCPSNVTAVADANSCAATGVVLGTPTTSDNCIGTVTVTNNAPSSFPIGNTIVTWTATDAAGNTQTCTQTVTVSDTQKPAITCSSNVTAVADTNSCVAAGVVLETPTTSDNCIGTVTVTNNAPSSFPIGNTIVTWTATDAAGNTQTCTQTVTVSDTQKPTITCPSNVTAVADANSCVAAGVVLGTPATSDNCTGTITVTNNAPLSFPIGNTIVTWTATDAAGNAQTCTQTVTVSDTQKPAITCPSNVTAVADANSCAATGVVLGTPTTSDNCIGTVIVTNNAPSSFPIGNTIVTWTATDAEGNTQTCSQTVTVSDTQKPTITCPSNVTAVADANSCVATGVVLGTPTTSDNCSGTVTVTNNAPSSFPIGNTIVTWTATDATGNTQTCTQTVTVSDTQKPTITCPSNVTVVADTNSCVATGVVLEMPTTSDNCIGTVIVTNNAPSSFPIGNTIVTWTATDAAGNTQTCTQTVTVSDTQKPAITCPSNVTAIADTNSCVAAGVVLGTPATSDNCTGTITVTNNAPSSFPIGNTIVTWTATDAAGNTQTCTQTVTVSDTQKPTITCPSNVTAVADANSCTATGVVLGTPTTSDNCTGTVTVTNNAPSSFPIGNTIVTWTATDAAGNTQTCTQTVTVSDTQKPTITCPSNVTAVADANSCTATGVVLGTPTTSDNCTGTITVTNNAPLSFPIGNTIVTWTATDAAGNTQTCTQTVTVNDTQKPTITCPSNVTVVADTNSCVAAGVVLETPTTSDNCIGTVVVTNNAPSSFPIGNTIVTWTATDAAGNTQTCTQTVTVSDTQKPTITCPSNVTAVADTNSCVAAGVVLGIPATTDNCTGTVTVTNNAPSSFPIGNTIVTWTATDAAGNTQTCTQTVKVVGPIKANDDIVLSLNGYTGGTAVSNVLSNDFLNCSNVIADDVNLTLSNTLPSVLNFNTTTGSVTVNPQTPAGTYSFDYTICEKSNPTNCSIASVTITVFAPIIDAVTETTSPINGTIGGTTPSLVLNDTLNGAAVVIGTNPGEVILSPVSFPTGLILNADGTVKVGAGTPAGMYSVEYKICEVNNPTNCDGVISAVVVTGGILQANSDTIGSVVGVNQPTILINVFANDTNNNLPVVLADMNLSVLTADPTGAVTLNPDGTAILGANTPAGTYELIYQICEKLNPTNCSSASIKVTVIAPTMKVTANSYCSNDVPYVSYNVTADNFTPNNLLTIKWIDSANNVVATQTNLPLSGNILWPGAVVDNNGIGIDWPGWLLANGQWIEAADGFEKTRTGVTMQFSLNPTVDVVVNYPPATPQCNARPTFAIQANNDTAGTNKTINVFNNDTLNGSVVNPSSVVLSTVTANPYLILNADGSVQVKMGAPSGNYQLTYQICDALNLSNCSQATVSVDVSNVSPPPPPAPTKQIIATDDTATSVDGINGSLEFINVLENDLLNGLVINPANIVIKNIPQSPYFEFNTDGTVNVKPNTPGGNYALIYQICEKANSSNCITATLNVFVEVPAIAIIKTALFNDENASGFANAGETITYKFKVTNTGNVPLKGITVSDPLTGIVLSGSAIDLDVNESDDSNFTAQYKITQKDINFGSVSNQAIVQGKSARGVIVDDKSDDSTNAEDKPTI